MSSDIREVLRHDRSSRLSGNPRIPGQRNRHPYNTRSSDNSSPSVNEEIIDQSSFIFRPRIRSEIPCNERIISNLPPINSTKSYITIILMVLLAVGIISSSGLFIMNLFDRMNAVKKDVQNLLETRDFKLSTVEKLLDELISAQDKCATLDMEIREKEKMTFQDLVKQVLEKYDADKTGKTDFALESLGGRILHIRNTETYEPRFKFLGIPVFDSANGPQAMIQPGVLPGECWAFKGSTGSAVIKLAGTVNIHGVSLEHISKNVSPSGVINTAPKEFSIWGLDDPGDKDGDHFGNFTYDSFGSPLQHFNIINTKERSYQFVEFKVHSNHGHPDFTCVYRLRVHGTLN